MVHSILVVSDLLGSEWIDPDTADDKTTTTSFVDELSVTL